MPSLLAERALSFKRFTLVAPAIRIITHSKISPFRHNQQPDAGKVELRCADIYGLCCVF